MSISTCIVCNSFSFLCEAGHQSLQHYTFTLENPNATKLKCSRGINWRPCLTDQNKSGRQAAPFAKCSDPQLQPYRLHCFLGWVRLPTPSPAAASSPRCLLPSAWLCRLLSMPRASWLAPGRQGTWHCPHLLASWWIDKMDCSTHEKFWDADMPLLCRERHNVTAPNCPGKWLLSAASAGCSLPHLLLWGREQRSFSGML